MNTLDRKLFRDLLQLRAQVAKGDHGGAREENV